MASKIDLSPLPPFDPLSDPSSLSQQWTSWTKRFQTYLTAMNITNDKQKRAKLHKKSSTRCQKLHKKAKLHRQAKLHKKSSTRCQKLEKITPQHKKSYTYFSPEKNIDYQIFQFRQTVQQPGETVDQLITRLRKLAATCEFHNVSKEIKLAIIQNCYSK